MNNLVFYFWGIIIAVNFMNIYIADRKTINYLKIKHREFYEENIAFFSGGASGSTIYQFSKKLNDPTIDNMEKQRNKSVKRMIISIVLSFVGIAIYVILSDFYRRH